MKKKLSALFAMLLAFTMLINPISNSVNAAGIVNSGTYASSDNVYYAKDKQSMLAIYTNDNQLAESWAFCINENKGTPSYDGNSYYVGTYAYKGNNSWALYQELSKSYPRYSQDQIYSVIQALLYMFHEDPFGYKNSVSDYEYWTIVQDLVYYYTQSRNLTTWSENNKNQVKDAMFAKAEGYRNSTLSEEDADLLIPNSKKIEVRTYEATSGGVQSLVTARVTDKPRVYFSKQEFKEGITDEEVLNNINNAGGLAGATFRILDSNGNALTNLDTNTPLEWTSNENPQGISLESGEYTLIEVSAPDGYAIGQQIRFKVDGTSNAEKQIVLISEREDTRLSDNDTIVLLDKKTEPEAKKVVIKKVGYDGQTLVAGANMSIYTDDENRTKVVDFISNNADKQIVELTPGNYILSETSAPQEYKNLQGDIKFNVADDGSITIDPQNNAAGFATVENNEIAVKNIKGPSLKTTASYDSYGTKWLTMKDTETKDVTIIDKVEYSEIEKGDYVLIAGLIKNYDENSKVEFDKVNSGYVEFETTESGNGFVNVEIKIPKDKLEIGKNTYTVVERLYRAEDVVNNVPNPGAQPVAEHVSYNDQNQTVGITIEEPIYKFAFWKVDENNEPLAGARLQILDKNGKPVPGMIWNSLTDSPTRIYLTSGSYTLKEVTTPQGYTTLADAKFEVSTDGKITFNDTNAVVIEQAADNGYFVRVKNTKAPTWDVNFSKTEVNKTEELPGANLKVLKGESADGDVVQEWTSTAERKVIALTEGTYTMVETQAPDGYEVAESITFRVTSEGKVEIKGADGNYSENTDKLVQMQDAKIPEEPTTPSLATTVTANGKEANETTPANVTKEEAQAGVKVTDTIVYKNLVGGKSYTVTGQLLEVANGQVVGDAKETKQETLTADNTGSGTWTIDFGTVEGLEEGKTYVVFESAVSVDMLIDENGDGTADKAQEAKHEDPTDKSQTITVGTTTPANAKDVVISKVNLGGEEIAGAKIQIKKGDTVVEEWTSVANESHTAKLAPGDYTFHEVAAPSGYKVVTDITFNVAEDGTVTVTSATTTGEAKIVDGKLVVTDSVYAGGVENDENSPNLATTVKAGESTANETTPAKVTKEEAQAGVMVTDTIVYKNLVGGAKYNVTGTLYEVVNGEPTNTPIKEATGEFTADNSGSGEWNLNFGTVEGLEEGKTYVVFERAVSVDDLVDTDGNGEADAKQEAKHEDPTDKSQTITVGTTTPEEPTTPSLATTVTANGKEANKTTPANVTKEEAQAGVTVTDTITYKNLTAGKDYVVKGQLLEVANGQVVGDAKATKQETLTADNTGSGTWTIDFGTVEGLEEGKTYVVFESAVSVDDLVDTDGNGEPDAKQEAKHEDPTDKSQTITVGTTTPEEPTYPTSDGELATTVQARNSKAGETTETAVITAVEAEHADGVQVYDYIDYKGLVKDKIYNVTAKLYKVENNQTEGEPLLTKEVRLKATDTNGQWIVDLGNTKDLQPEASYVVFEKAVSVENLVDENGDGTPDRPQTGTHEDPTDPSQTVTVEPKTPTPNVPENPVPLTPENEIDQKLGTTVTANNTTASADKAAEIAYAEAVNGVTVTDTITYEGLIAGKTYTVTAKLYQVVDGVAKGEAILTATKDIVAETTDGTWTIELGTTTALQKDTSYVVFEKAVSTEAVLDTDGDDIADKVQTAVHEDANDKSQTVTVGPEEPTPFVPVTPTPEEPENPDNPNGSLRTTVKANGISAGINSPVYVDADDAEFGVQVIDTIYYSGLVAGEAYTVTGTLYRVVGNQIVGAPILTATQTYIASTTGEGDWTLNLGNTTLLQPNEKYVVFEEAVSVNNLIDNNNDGTKDEKQTVVHNDPSDQSQTIVVRPNDPWTPPTPPTPNIPIVPVTPTPNVPENPTPNVPEEPKPNEPQTPNSNEPNEPDTEEPNNDGSTNESFEQNENNGYTVPKTGDETNIALFVVAFVAATVVVLFANRKRFLNNNK